MTAVLAAEIDWMRLTASRLADAMGWPLTWSPPASEPPTELRDVYHIEVRDEEAAIGRLSLELPDDPKLDASFQAAREVTEVFADILSRLAAANRRCQTQSQDVSTLVEVGKAVPRATNLQTALSQLMRAAAQLSGLWSGAFFLFDPRESQLRLRATHHLPAKAVPGQKRWVDERSPDGCAWQQGPRFLDRMKPADAGWLPPGMAVGLCVPILAESCLIGSLWCNDRRHRPLGEWESQVLQSVAAQIGSILERTVLLRESAQQQQIQSEIRLASSKLPVGMLDHPPPEWGLEIAVRAATVSGVGGDFVEAIPLENQRTLIAIGDAVGHSIPAAMLVSVARGALRALVTQAPAQELQTEVLMSGVNRALCAVTRAEQFVTLMLGIVDSQAKTFTYTNAGHPPALLLRGDTWTTLNSHGLFLGVESELAYRAEVLKLAPGDVTVFYTDGITETINQSQQVFRRQGIEETIPAAAQATADAIAETIWTRVEAHDSGQPLRDDRTLLVLKYHGQR